jgi:DNA polymerase-3 subunit gamma/tau
LTLANHDSKSALSILDKSYAEGKDLKALFDELACLLRDLMILQTAPHEGISLLSGIASEEQAEQLVRRFSPAELVYMMNMVQTTLNGFTKSVSRRVDAELCLINLCKPELSLDAQSLNARLGRLEQQLKNGEFVAAVPKSQPKQALEDDEERPPFPDDEDAPPSLNEEPEQSSPVEQSEAPIGFWSDLVSEIRTELKPPLTGFISTSPTAPVRGVLVGDRLELRCNNDFVTEVINKPDVVRLFSERASAKLGKPVRAVVVDGSAKPSNSKKMESLLSFGHAHSGVVKIKNEH